MGCHVESLTAHVMRRSGRALTLSRAPVAEVFNCGHLNTIKAKEKVALFQCGMEIGKWTEQLGERLEKLRAKIKSTHFGNAIFIPFLDVLLSSFIHHEPKYLS